MMLKIGQDQATQLWENYGTIADQIFYLHSIGNFGLKVSQYSTMFK
jgi:hypothetical protein